MIGAFAHNLLVGLIFLTSFVQANEILAQSKIEYKIYNITHLKHKESGSKGNRSLTLNVTINIKNKKKTFTLSNGDSKKILSNINNWKVEVGIKKGRLGYSFIESIKALE